MFYMHIPRILFQGVISFDLVNLISLIKNTPLTLLLVSFVPLVFGYWYAQFWSS